MTTVSRQLADGSRIEWDYLAETVQMFDADGVSVSSQPIPAHQVALFIKSQARSADPSAHRDALAHARVILLEYRYGAPGTPTFPEVLGPVQTAVLDYRDSGIKDPECDEHIMWINARVNEINAAALYGAGVLK